MVSWTWFEGWVQCKLTLKKEEFKMQKTINLFVKKGIGGL